MKKLERSWARWKEEWIFYFLIVIDYLQYIFLKYINSDSDALTTTNYTKQLSKVKYTYKRFKKEYNFSFYFPVVFK